MPNNTQPVKRGVLFLAATILSTFTTFSNAEDSASTKHMIIDSHLHVVSPGNWDASPIKALGLSPNTPTGEVALELLNDSDVDRAVLVSTAYLYPDRKASENENSYIADLVAKNPDKFSGLCAIQPMLSWALEELERCVNSLGLNGLKLHFGANKMDVNDPEHAAALMGILQKSAELKKGFPILIDFNWMDDAQTLTMIQLAVANPNVNIIMAHGLGHHYKEFVNVDIFKKMFKGALSNLFVDISATLTIYPPDSPSFDDYIWHLRKMGTEQILFGSDYPMETPQKSYEAFLKMGFTPEEQIQIQGENAARLFGVK